MSNLLEKCSHIGFKYFLPYNFVELVFKNKKNESFFPSELLK